MENVKNDHEYWLEKAESGEVAFTVLANEVLGWIA